MAKTQPQVRFSCKAADDPATRKAAMDAVIRHSIQALQPSVGGS